MLAPYRLGLDNFLALSCHFVTTAAFAACLFFKLSAPSHVAKRSPVVSVPTMRGLGLAILGAH